MTNATAVNAVVETLATMGIPLSVPLDLSLSLRDSLGFDSIEIVELTAEVGKRLGIGKERLNLRGCHTVGDLTQTVGLALESACA